VLGAFALFSVLVGAAVLGADPAEGNPTSDDSALTVLDRRTRQKRTNASAANRLCSELNQWFRGGYIMNALQFLPGILAAFEPTDDSHYRTRSVSLRDCLVLALFQPRPSALPVHQIIDGSLFEGVAIRSSSEKILGHWLQANYPDFPLFAKDGVISSSCKTALNWGKTPFLGPNF
jgi:hypothetical protein